MVYMKFQDKIKYENIKQQGCEILDQKDNN